MLTQVEHHWYKLSPCSGLVMFPGVINPAARPDPFWLLPTLQASFLLGWPSVLRKYASPSCFTPSQGCSLQPGLSDPLSLSSDVSP